MSVAGSLRPSRLVARMASSLSLAFFSSIDLGAAAYRGVVPAVWHVAVRRHSSRASAGTPRSLIERSSTQQTISERSSRLVPTSRGAHRSLTAPPSARRTRHASLAVCSHARPASRAVSEAGDVDSPPAGLPTQSRRSAGIAILPPEVRPCGATWPGDRTELIRFVTPSVVPSSDAESG
jgi:hypothetical protein